MILALTLESGKTPKNSLLIGLLTFLLASKE